MIIAEILKSVLNNNKTILTPRFNYHCVIFIFFDGNRKSIFLFLFNKPKNFVTLTDFELLLLGCLFKWKVKLERSSKRFINIQRREDTCSCYFCVKPPFGEPTRVWWRQAVIWIFPATALKGTFVRGSKSSAKSNFLRSFVKVTHCKLVEFKRLTTILNGNDAVNQCR